MKLSFPPSPRLTRFCIWSVAYQDFIAGQVRIYIAAGSGVVTLFFLSGALNAEQFGMILLTAGAGIAGLLFALIQARRSVLLAIREPALRRLAFATMRLYIAHRQPALLDAVVPIGRRLPPACRDGHCRG